MKRAICVLMCFIVGCNPFNSTPCKKCSNNGSFIRMKLDGRKCQYICHIHVFRGNKDNHIRCIYNNLYQELDVSSDEFIFIED